MLNKATICLVEEASFDTKKEAILSYLRQELSMSANLVNIIEYPKDSKYFFLSIFGVQTGRVAFTGVFTNPNKFKSYILKKICEYQEVVKPTLFTSITSENNLYKAIHKEGLTAEELALYCEDLISLAAISLKYVDSIPKPNLVVIQSYLDMLHNKQRVAVKKLTK
ncbi:MAG: hypothetical protein EOM67_15370 [Spirochaetia bacterium]|nr:hypothetical protein [Spirochaetia bacterium]